MGGGGGEQKKKCYHHHWYSVIIVSAVCVPGVAGAVGGGGGRSPQYVWPLGNTTVHHEVMAAHDAHLPDSSQCFVFQQPYPGLPYDAITLGARGKFVDINLAGEVNFQVGWGSGRVG